MGFLRIASTFAYKDPFPETQSHSMFCAKRRESLAFRSHTHRYQSMFKPVGQSVTDQSQSMFKPVHESGTNQSESIFRPGVALKKTLIKTHLLSMLCSPGRCQPDNQMRNLTFYQCLIRRIRRRSLIPLLASSLACLYLVGPRPGVFGKDHIGSVMLGDRCETSGPAGDWQVKKEQNGMAAEVAADGQTPDGTAKTTLSFQCSPGKGGTSTITFIVLGAFKMKGFDFDDFEGPDAPAQRHAQVTLTTHRLAGDLVIKTPCTGYYTVSDEGFAFEITTMASVRGKVTQLSDALIQGATGISIRIKGLKHPEKIIEANFPATGAAAALTQVMQGCGSR